MTDWYNRWANSHLPEPDTAGEKAAKQRAYQRMYRERNRERLREYHKAYYRGHKEKWRRPRPEHDYKDCAVCGNPFYPFHFSDKYCCARCRRKGSRHGNVGCWNGEKARDEPVEAWRDDA